MSDISKAVAELKEDFESANNLVDELYHKYFARFFQKESEMFDRFRDADVPINDTELEWILISLPLELKMAANSLAQFKQYNEIVKLRMKQRKSAGVDDSDGLDAEFKLMNIIYTSVITRVELEISFSKELIMGAKKVWDARRSGETPPIGETNTDLPEYKLDNDNSKIQF